jgi:hypothetical protein
LIFPRVYPPQLVYYQGREFFVDRAHNLLLDWAVTAGVPGLLAFLFLLLVFLYVAGWGRRRSYTRRKRLLLTAVLSAVMANVANNLVSFDVTPTAVAFWLLMGMGFALASPPARLRSGTVLTLRRRWAAAFLLLLFFAFAVWQANGRPLAADIYARTAERRMLAGEWSAANDAAARAAALWPVEADFHLLQSSTAWQLARHDAARSAAALQQAESALRQACQTRPGDWTIWQHTAQFYASAARRFGLGSRSRVFDAYRQAAALAPNQAAVYTAWGRAYLEEQNPAAAAPLLRQALRLDATSETAAAYLSAAEQALETFESK